MRVMEFDVTWTVKGKAEIEVPDDFDTSDNEAFKKYVETHWSEVRRPSTPVMVLGSEKYATKDFPVCIYAYDDDVPEDEK